MKKKYHIAFDTKKVPGSIVALSVEIGHETYKQKNADNTKFSVDLCDHPLYPQLEAYVRANPSPKPIKTH